MQLYESSGRSLCLGMELFHTLHTVLHEFILRTGVDDYFGNPNILKCHLSEVVEQLTALRNIQEISPVLTHMRSACAAAMKEYIPYYSSMQPSHYTPVEKLLLDRLFH